MKTFTPRPFTRSEFYWNAAVHLGLVETVNRALQYRFGDGDMMLSSRYLDHPVKVRRDTSDLLTFDMIFVEREYRCLDDLQNVCTVLDAGANCGYSSAYFLSRFPGSRVVAVEPDRANYELTIENLAPYGSRATTFCAAVWSHATSLSFDKESLEQNNEWGRRTEEGEGDITAYSVPDLMRMGEMDNIDILKVDIEGAEREVFGSENTSWLRKVRNLVIEPHGPECLAAIENAMKPYRFERSQSGELAVFRNIL